jgi:hypothetical protein
MRSLNQPIVQEGDREHRHDDRRQDRDQAEHRHQPRVQARARQTLAAGHDQLDDAARDDHAEHEQEDQVEVEKAEHQVGLSAEVQPPGDGDIGRQPGQHRGRGQRQRQLGADLGAAQPTDEPAPAGRRRGGQGTCHDRPAQRSVVASVARAYRGPRITSMSSSRIFLRNVLRLTPSRAAARN